MKIMEAFAHYPLKVKILLLFPVVAIVFYAFARPEYHYVMSSDTQINKDLDNGVLQKEARGVVINEDGEPLQGVRIIVTKSTIGVTTDARGRFAVSSIPGGSALIFSCRGYKTYTLPPLLASNSALRVRMVKNPDYDEQSEVSSVITTKNQQLIQKTIKGIILNENGQPLEGVEISSTGIIINTYHTTTLKDGRFEINNLQDDASLIVYCRGYKQLTLKPDFDKEMSVRMEIDPGYNALPPCKILK